MSATLGVMLKELDPTLEVHIVERLGTLEARRDWGDRCRARVRSRHSPAAHTEATIGALERLARIPTAPHPRPAARAAG